MVNFFAVGGARDEEAMCSGIRRKKRGVERWSKERHVEKERSGRRSEGAVGKEN